jgi:hypothetical protein
MTVKVTLVTPTGRKLVQNIAGCESLEHGKGKCKTFFPGCKVKKVELADKEKKNADQ